MNQESEAFIFWLLFAHCKTVVLKFIQVRG